MGRWDNEVKTVLRVDMGFPPNRMNDLKFWQHSYKMKVLIAFLCPIIMANAIIFRNCMGQERGACMTTVNYINLSLQIWGCISSFMVGICLFLTKRKRDLLSRLYFRMLICNVGVMSFDALSLLFRGRLGAIAFWGVRITNFAAYCCNYILIITFLHYLTVFLEQRVSITRKMLWIGRVICGVSLCLMVATQFLPIFYYFDAENIYHRAPLFYLSQLSGVVCMLLCAYLLIKYRKSILPLEKFVLWLYILLPVLALVIQIFIYGLVFLNLANTLSLLIVYLFLQVEQGRRITEQENELTQSRISIMMSQIQPHFLYNSLNSIYYLCELDPSAAQRAINDFSTYEKMRFDEDLNIEYGIEATGFMIPALSVQPLVENAVKYGVGKKIGGGAVTICTRELETQFEIMIIDDGVGYDPYKTQDDGRTHIGIENVRKRLETIVCGSLEIQSEKGVGTTAIIGIPKEKTP